MLTLKDTCRSCRTLMKIESFSIFLVGGPEGGLIPAFLGQIFTKSYFPSACLAHILILFPFSTVLRPISPFRTLLSFTLSLVQYNARHSSYSKRYTFFETLVFSNITFTLHKVTKLSNKTNVTCM